MLIFKARQERVEFSDRSDGFSSVSFNDFMGKREGGFIACVPR